MIQVQNLNKTYGNVQAISNLNFSVKKGEVVGFLGPNGAGKSTTMKIITGYMAPTEGMVNVAGFDVFDQPLEVKRRIGYLPETPPVYLDMYVEDYLKFVAELKKVTKDRIPKLVDRAIEKTNLGAVKNRLVGHLSKGFRQRVGIAQALVSDPEVLILDEPTVGLDPVQVLEVRGLVQELAGEHTIILSTHILPEVQAICGRVIIINKGHIVAEDTLSGLSQRLQGGQRVFLRFSKEVGDLSVNLGRIPGVRSVHAGDIPKSIEVDTDGSEAALLTIASETVRSGAGLLEMKPTSLSLEDIFIKLTTNEVRN